MTYKQTIDALEKLNVPAADEKYITLCPECFAAFDTRVPDNGLYVLHREEPFFGETIECEKCGYIGDAPPMDIYEARDLLAYCYEQTAERRL